MSQSPTNGGTFDFDEHRRGFVQHYQVLRPLYEDFATTVSAIFQEAIRAARIKVASIEARAKSPDSFGEKAGLPAEEDSNRPRYPDPLSQITDLAAARVITFFLSTVYAIDQLICAEFKITERSDKGEVLLEEERLGYRSLHYVVELKPNRTALPEYARYNGIKAEIQLRTVLQHAWAEIEHDIQYKSAVTVPTTIRRKFMALAGLLEIADREFQAVQIEDEELRVAARRSVSEGRLDQVEITSDALKTYLDYRLGQDGRMTKGSYEWMARLLRSIGFDKVQQINEAIAPYNDDELSRKVHGGRQGQLTRFEDMIMAALGDKFLERHELRDADWWVKWKRQHLDRIKQAGVPIGFYDPRVDT